MAVEEVDDVEDIDGSATTASTGVEVGGTVRFLLTTGFLAAGGRVGE